MVDTTVLIPPEEKKKPTPMQWTYMLSLVLSCIAIIFGIFGACKKVSSIILD